MEKIAVIQLGGKQFMVTDGTQFEIERQKKLDINVLLFFDGKKVFIGEPYLSDVVVDADLEDGGRAKKITVARFKSKSRYRKKKGHRQPLSVVKVKSVGKKSVSTKTTKKETKKVTKVKPEGKKK